MAIHELNEIESVEPLSGFRGRMVPGGVPHGGRALSGCWILDVFVPVRKDCRQLSG